MKEKYRVSALSDSFISFLQTYFTIQMVSYFISQEPHKPGLSTDVSKDSNWVMFLKLLQTLQFIVPSYSPME